MKRVCFVVDELLGQNRNGGIGTTTTWRSLVLAASGIDVTVLLFAGRSEIDAAWASRYADAGVTIRWSESGRAVLPGGIGTGVRVYRALLEGPAYDAVVFQDWLAPGWTSMAAKRAGVAFAATTLVHSVHGPTEWVLDANNDRRPGSGFFLRAVAERTSAELSDVVVSPSRATIDWMMAAGWDLPATRLIPRITERHLAPDRLPSPEVRTEPGSLQELVFFGRLQERKGVRVLTGALRLLADDALRGLRVTFLGRPGDYDQAAVTEQIPPEVRAVLADLSFITDFDQPEALRYLRESGRLALIPSLAENASNAVAECVEHAVPMLVSNAAGVAEAIDPRDHEGVTFVPTPAGLADRLAPLLRGRRLPAPARAAATSDPIAQWEELLVSPAAVATDTIPRPTIAITSAPDGRSNWTRADEEFVVFTDAVDLDAGYVKTMTDVATRTAADAVTCAVRHPDGDRYYLGRGLDAAVLLPTLGGPGTLWRRAAVEQLGGFARELEPAYLDAELLLRLAARGGRIVAVPEVLATLTVPAGDDADYLAACQATYRTLVPPTFAWWPRLIAGQQENVRGLMRRTAELQEQIEQLESDLEAANAHVGHFLGLAVKASREDKRRR